jgi:hypothetical protein
LCTQHAVRAEQKPVSISVAAASLEHQDHAYDVRSD